MSLPPPVQRPSNLSERARRYAALPISVFGEAIVRNYKNGSNEWILKPLRIYCVNIVLPHCQHDFAG